MLPFTFRKHFLGFQASVSFANGYGLSVIPEIDGKTYEVAIMYGGTVCYDSGLTDDVFRFRTVDEVYQIYDQTVSLS